MPKVEIRNRSIWVGKKRIPLISGEVHYWRVNPSSWSDILERIREAGIRVVSTYVPWDYHEYKRGKFDFTGLTDRARNLKRFLELTREKKFWVVIRPGPYIYSEWPNEGIPDYAHQYHRLHPKFLAYAKEYLKRVTQVLRPFLATRRGGHILLLQADNEIDPWPDTFGHQYGLNSKPGLFQEFIKELYRGDLEKLNESWGTEYQNFEEAGPFVATMLKGEQGVSLKGDKELKRNIDYFKFKHEYSVKYARWAVETFRSLGIDIPIYLNLYPFFYAHDWLQMQGAADAVGIDLYPSGELAEDRFEQRKFTDKVRYLSRISPLPFIAEFGAGVWHARHYESGVFTPNHYRLIALSALLGGICGWNWYMLVNRDNWYMSPINEWGRVRPELYNVFLELVKIFQKMDPPSLKQLCEIGVTFNPIQYAARTLSHNNSILGSLSAADVDYFAFDPRRPIVEPRVLFYSGNQWLDREAQENLRRYVERGGTLVAFLNFPRKDEDFMSADLIGFEEPSRILFEFKQALSIQFAPGRPKILLTSSVFCFDRTGNHSIEATLGPYGRHPVGYRKQIGKGQLIHLGFEPTPELIRELLQFLKIPLYSHSVTDEIKTALFERKNKTCYLVAINNGNEEKSARIRLPYFSKRGKYRVRDLATDKKETVSFGRDPELSVNLPRKDGRVLELKKI